MSANTIPPAPTNEGLYQGDRGQRYTSRWMLWFQAASKIVAGVFDAVIFTRGIDNNGPISSIGAINSNGQVTSFGDITSTGNLSVNGDTTLTGLTIIDNELKIGKGDDETSLVLDRELISQNAISFRTNHVNKFLVYQPANEESLIFYNYALTKYLMSFISNGNILFKSTSLTDIDPDATKAGVQVSGDLYASGYVKAGIKASTIDATGAFTGKAISCTTVSATSTISGTAITGSSLGVTGNISTSAGTISGTISSTSGSITSLSCTGLTAGGITMTGGTISATTTTANLGAISGTSVSSTGAISGASVSSTGAISGASVSSTGAISGTSVSSTGAISGASVTAPTINAVDSVYHLGSVTSDTIVANYNMGANNYLYNYNLLLSGYTYPTYASTWHGVISGNSAMMSDQTSNTMFMNAYPYYNGSTVDYRAFATGRGTGWGLGQTSATLFRFDNGSAGNVTKDNAYTPGIMLTVNYDGTVGFYPVTATSAATGTATALPAQPAGYIKIQVNGADKYLPYYN